MLHFNFDILALIFIEALHTGSSSLLTLRLVNWAWYEITGRIPQLWTKLVLNRKSHFTDLKYAQLYFRKSGTLPMDIHIALPNDVDASQIEGIAGFLHGQTLRFRSFAMNWRSSSFLWLKTGLPHYSNLRSSEFKGAQHTTPSSTLNPFLLPSDLHPAWLTSRSQDGHSQNLCHNSQT